MNLEPKILCPECFNIPLLGIDFNQEAENLNSYIDLYSLCIFKHKKTVEEQLLKNNLDNIFSNINSLNNNTSNFKELYCECCNQKPFEYHCFNCKRNICKNCLEYHKSHKYYYNYDYISADELQQINKKLKQSKITLDSNYILIEKIILKYEEQLEQLKNLYAQYKKMNDNLSSISSFVLKKYTDLLNIRKPIYYPLYFNLKNILSFDPIQIKIKEENLSINDFINILAEKIFSGLHFIITDSTLSKNLNNYDKINKFKNDYDITNLESFMKKNIEYDKIIPLTDNKFIGLNEQKYYYNDSKQNKNSKEGLEIYNINNQIIETEIKSIPEDVYFNEKYNLIIFLYEDSIDIYNYTKFKCKQQIKTIDEKSKRKRRFSPLWKNSEREENSYYILRHVELISENTIGVVYEGDLNYLDEDVDNLFNMTNVTEIINIEDNDNINEDWNNFSYFIIYQKENEDSDYIPKNVSLLVRMNISMKDVPYFSSADIENDYEGDYCSFTFDSITQISNNEFIFGFKSKIENDRNQENIYITDDFYHNEMIYYYLNWEKNYSINTIIGSTKEDSYLFKNKNDEQFYFIYNSSEEFASNLKDYFNEKKLKVITININDKLDIRNLYIEKHNIIGWDKSSIYIGKIISGELEIISSFEFTNGENIKYISVKNKCIYYKKDEENNLDN